MTARTYVKFGPDGDPAEIRLTIPSSEVPADEAGWRERIGVVAGVSLPPEREVVLTQVRLWGPPDDTEKFSYCRFAIRDRSTFVDLDGLELLRAVRRGRPPRRVSVRSASLGSSMVLAWGDWQVGKMLQDDTPMLTPDGWTTHGDLRPGMSVFGQDGRPKLVLKVMGSSQQELFDVEFGDGTVLRAGAEHLWSGCRTMHPSGRAGARRADWEDRPMTLSTLEIARLLEQECYVNRPFWVLASEPLALPPAALPIAPHLLGLWLGDGNSAGGLITKGRMDAALLLQHGHEVKNGDKDAITVSVPGLTAKLRALGVQGNKHVPDAYLYAGMEQRLALVQGLMDTDGSCAEGGACEFSNTNQQIAESVMFLLRSLGMRPRMTAGVGKLNGVEKKPYWRITFRPTVEVFTLARKAERARVATKREHIRRSIIAIRPAGPGSAQCITVEGSLYLAGRELVVTHNSEGGGTPALFERMDRQVGAAIERLSEIPAARRPAELVILGVGDMVEGCNIFPNQAFQLDSDRRTQVRNTATLILDSLDRLAPHFARVHVAATAGNHGQHRQEGKPVNAHDNDDLAVFEHAARAASRDPSLQHVVWTIPLDEPAVVLDVQKHHVAVTHGHHFGNGSGVEQKAYRWFCQQAAGQLPPGLAGLLVSGHFHHHCLADWGATQWVQIPANDGGSAHFTDRTGRHSRPGTLSWIMTPAERYLDPQILR